MQKFVVWIISTKSSSKIMKNNELDSDNCIAPCELDIVDKAGNVISKVNIMIGKPEQLSNQDWSCSYRILGLDDDTTYRVNGLDSIQAIKCVFTVIDGILSGTHLVKQGILQWNGETDLGF